MAVRIIVGDALTSLHTLESESVQICVTSPPYFQLRDYQVGGQIGLEQTPADFIAALLAVFDEVRRVLRPDGLCFVHIGDSYAGSGKGPTGHNGIGDQEQRQGFVGVSDRSTLNNGRGVGAHEKVKQAVLGGGVGVEGIPAKNLLLIPHRFAIAMQDAGWYVRSCIVWAKTSAMPESVKDRPTSAWEPIWMFAKSRTYYYDQAAVRSELKAPNVTVPSGFGGHKRNGGTTYSGNPYDGSLLAGANLRNFWLLGPSPFTGEHYAAFPTAIPKRCILAGSRPGDTVLDPFLGSGTTALVADRLGRNAIGIELSPTYAAMAQRRIDSDAPLIDAIEQQAAEQPRQLELMEAAR